MAEARTTKFGKRRKIYTLSRETRVYVTALGKGGNETEFTAVVIAVIFSSE